MTIEEYFAVAGSGYHDKDAAIIGPELERLAAAGVSTKSGIKEAARPEDSPLHPFVFDCSPAEAAERHYDERAAHVARSINVLVRDDNGNTRTMRAFYPVIVDAASPDEQRPYVSIRTILAERDLATQVWQDGLRRLQRFRAQFRDYDDVFGPVIRAIDQVERDLEETA